MSNKKEDKENKRFFHKYYIAPIIATFISGILVALITVFILEKDKPKNEENNSHNQVEEQPVVVEPPNKKQEKSTKQVFVIF